MPSASEDGNIQGRQRNTRQSRGDTNLAITASNPTKRLAVPPPLPESSFSLTQPRAIEVGILEAAFCVIDMFTDILCRISNKERLSHVQLR